MTQFEAEYIRQLCNAADEWDIANVITLLEQGKPRARIDFLKAIAHDTVHIKQSMDRRLRDRRNRS